MLYGFTMLYLGGDTYYSPPFPRGGLAATFSFSMLGGSLSASVGVQVAVEHKNHEDTTWSSAGTVGSRSTNGTTSNDITGLKEEIRFAYSFVNGTPTPTDAAHLIVMAPAWRAYA